MKQYVLLVTGLFIGWTVFGYIHPASTATLSWPRLSLTGAPGEADIAQALRRNYHPGPLEVVRFACQQHQSRPGYACDVQIIGDNLFQRGGPRMQQNASGRYVKQDDGEWYFRAW